MKLPPFTGKKAVRSNRLPMITFAEAAELLGVSANQLRSDFRFSLVPTPKSKAQTFSSLSQRASWYEVKEFKAWRVAFLAAKANRIANGVSV